MRCYFILIILLWATQTFGLEAKDSIDKTSQTVIEGTLSQVSKLPQAQGNAYPDCYYTATVEIAHIVSGRSISNKIILVLPGFFARQYAPEAGFKTGDKLRATIVPFASMPDKVRQTQQADDIENVDLEFYFPLEVALTQVFQDVANAVPFAGHYPKTAEHRDFPSVDPKARAARQEQMHHDLEQINSIIAGHGGDWDKWYESLRPWREQYQKEWKAQSRRWIGGSFFSAGYFDDGKIFSDSFIKSLMAFKKYLAARNVDLIVVRVPNKGEIVDDLFVPGPPDQVRNPYLLRLYKELLEADIEIVTDVIPDAKKNRLKYPLMYWYQDFAEPHPAEGISWVVADELARRLNRYEKIRRGSKTSFRKGETTTGTAISDDSHPFRWPDGNAAYNPERYVTFTTILTPDGTPVRPRQGTDSPVLVVGSSYIEYPSLRLGGNIPAYLAFLTGIVPDILYRSGSGVGIPRTIAREGDGFLKNRSVCLFPLQPWVFYDALSSPPIVDLAKTAKTQIASYVADKVKEQIRLAAGTPEHAFTYSADGSLNVHPLSDGSRSGGTIELTLPQGIQDFPFLMIEIETRLGDAAVVNAKMGNQVDSIHKSYSQVNSKDILVFKSAQEKLVQLSFFNIRKDLPTVIKAINIFGLRP